MRGSSPLSVIVQSEPSAGSTFLVTVIDPNQSSGSIGRISIRCSQDELFPQASVAVHVMIVVPHR